MHSPRFQLVAICPILLCTSPDHLSKLPFLSEFSAKNTKVIHQVFACSENCVFGCYVAICLDTEDELVKKWMFNLFRSASVYCRDVAFDTNLVAGEEDVRILKESGSKKVSKGVVFLHEGEDAGIWHTQVRKRPGPPLSYKVLTSINIHRHLLLVS